MKGNTVGRGEAEGAGLTVGCGEVVGEAEGEGLADGRGDSDGCGEAEGKGLAVGCGEVVGEAEGEALTAAARGATAVRACVRAWVVVAVRLALPLLDGVPTADWLITSAPSAKAEGNIKNFFISVL